MCELRGDADVCAIDARILPAAEEEQLLDAACKGAGLRWDVRELGRSAAVETLSVSLRIDE